MEKCLKSRSNRGLRNLRPIELKPIPYTLPAWPNVLGQPQQLVSLEQTIYDVDISCWAHLHDPWRVPKRSHRLFRRDQLIHRSWINRFHPDSLLLLLLDHLHLITWTNVDHPSSCVLDHHLLASMIKIQPWSSLLRIILLSGNYSLPGCAFHFPADDPFHDPDCSLGACLSPSPPPSPAPPSRDPAWLNNCFSGPDPWGGPWFYKAESPCLWYHNHLLCQL